MTMRRSPLPDQFGRLVEASRDLLVTVHAARHDGDIGPLGGQLQRDSRADSPTGPGDQGAPAGEPSGHRLRSSRRVTPG